MISTGQLLGKRMKTKRAFTLVEVVIAVTIGSLVMAGTLTTFMVMTRSGYNVGAYNEMEAESRSGLEIFARDVRMAKSIAWTSSDSFSLTVPGDAGDITYNYSYSGNKTFVRTDGGGANSRVLFTGVDQIKLRAFAIDGTEIVVDGNLTVANASTKLLQLELVAKRTRSTVATATNKVLSARFILRNHKITK
jgi:prepilin-type N-terminal cleavage/methylation domain-containing protein